VGAVDREQVPFAIIHSDISLLKAVNAIEIKQPGYVLPRTQLNLGAAVDPLPSRFHQLFRLPLQRLT
jgi:hypothetical protein